MIAPIKGFPNGRLPLSPGDLYLIAGDARADPSIASAMHTFVLFGWSAADPRPVVVREMRVLDKLDGFSEDQLRSNLSVWARSPFAVGVFDYYRNTYDKETHIYRAGAAWIAQVFLRHEDERIVLCGLLLPNGVWRARFPAMRQCSLADLSFGAQLLAEHAVKQLR